MVHHDICPLCASELLIPHFNCKDHFISKEIFELNKCTMCGFVFTQDYPEETEIERYYESDDYISHTDTKKGFSNKIYRFVRKAMLRKKKGIIENVTGLQKGNLLDIGSGTGHFASTMENAGWLVKGIEINERARQFSVSQFGLNVIHPDQITTLKSNSFDCITLWHVLEHFHDPFKYSSEILRLLKPNGLCLIALPNCNSFDASHFKQNWAAYDVPRHLWHFDPSSFKLFSEKSGFIQGKLRNLPLDVFYISILSEKYRGSKVSFLTGLIKALPFAFLSVFRLDRSSSVIYLIHKPTG